MWTPEERQLDGDCLRRPFESAEYVTIRYTERLAKAGIDPSVGSIGDSYDNALAETVVGLFKTEVIYRPGPWRSIDAVEFATLEWVEWYNKPPAPRTDRPHPARRGRGDLLPDAPATPDGGVRPNGTYLRKSRRGSFSLTDVPWDVRVWVRAECAAWIHFIAPTESSPVTTFDGWAHGAELDRCFNVEALSGYTVTLQKCIDTVA